MDVFQRPSQRHVALANDTSCGAGYAPFSELERVVLAVEGSLNHPDFKASHPESGEDIKVMGVRDHDRISLTISCAFIGRHLSGVGAYTDARDRVAAAALNAGQKVTQMKLDVRVNAADDLARGSVLSRWPEPPPSRGMTARPAVAIERMASSRRSGQ